MNIAALNALDPEGARAEFERCCGATRWVEAMEQDRPFADKEEIFTSAYDVWRRLSEADWLEAFRHHPRIGDVEGLRKKFATTRAWAAGEQAGAADASEKTLRALADGNTDYEQRFGYIFIVCATGKSADEMLAILRSRLPNNPASELQIAVAEQAKITRLRLEKLLS